jgi:hypothetical protein
MISSEASIKGSARLVPMQEPFAANITSLESISYWNLDAALGMRGRH